MKQKPVIIGIGELLWDMLPSGKKAGGAPVNFVYHASRLGAESYAISAVGNDPWGDEMIEEVVKAGIGHLIERVDHPTGTVLVELNSGNPSYTIIEGVAWDHIPLTKEMITLVQHADAICFGTLAQRSETSCRTIQTLLSHIPEASYRIFDINIRQHYYSKELILTSLAHCNIFKINNDELALLRKLFLIESMDDADACMWFVENFKLKYLILTAGAEESIIFAPERVSRIRTPVVEVADTVGAGDSFTGAFITSILKGKTLSEAHRSAVAQAALVCTRAGAWVSV
jgi:fructokinase